MANTILPRRRAEARAGKTFIGLEAGTKSDAWGLDPQQYDRKKRPVSQGPYFSRMVFSLVRLRG